jgi:glycosyltransferase involved in cell wall biosynthesis
MVLMLGSDIDLSEVFYEGSQESTNYGARGDWGYYALTKADLVITQTASQASMLKERFQRDCLTIKNPIDLSGFVEIPVSNKYVPMVLWVGKSDIVKRPEIFLGLAARYPQYSFEMIMNRSNEAIFEQIVRDATPNVKVIERVPFNEIEGYFARAKVLVNTSVFEGFPNAFLQAGKYGVPLLSLQVDPNGFIQNRRCGVMAAGDMEELSMGLKQLIENEEFYRTCSTNVRSYVKDNHELAIKVQELNDAISKLL